tara:strand:- start:121 stop:477 length:357 start_codon:yes stop_codon:yes gene_type:complete
MAYKMKGHSLPGIKQRKSPAKTDPTKGMSAEMKASHVQNRKDYEGSTQELQDNLNMNLKKMSGEKTDFQKELEKRGMDQKSPGKMYGKKSPAKCPLVAALAPMAIKAVGGMMGKKKEE